MNFSANPAFALACLTRRIRGMYEEINLRDWPFRIVPDENFAQIWAGRQQTKQQLERMLRKMQLTPTSAIRVLWANFGMGKTHTLLHLHHRSTKTSGRLIPIYAVMPDGPKKFLEVYRAIVTKLPYGYLGDQLVKLGGSIEGGVRLNPVFVKSPGVVNAILAMRRDDDEMAVIARQWLSAQSGLSQPQLRKIGVTYRINSPEDAINALTSLTKLATYRSSPAGAAPKLVVLLDEYQRIGEVKPQVRLEINTAVHTFFNDNASGLELVLTFSFGRQENVNFLLSNELRSRADPDTITLEVLSQVEAREFIRDLLGEFRIRADERWAYPFSPEAVDIIIRHVADRRQITPRRLMKLADYVLRESLLSQDGTGAKEITDGEVRQILARPELGSLDAEDEPAA
jgi:hypothetical protein